MDVIIVGAGGHGQVVLEILRRAGQFKPAGWIDADPSLAGSEVAGLPVFGHINALLKLHQQKIRSAIVAIGDCKACLSYANVLREHGFDLVNAIDPTAVVYSTAKLATNVVVAAGAVISTGCIIEHSTIVNTSATVDHECHIGMGVHVCPGARLAGRVTIGEGAFIGLGANIIQCRMVGEYAVIGAGATVIRDVPPHCTVVGTPARVIKEGAKSR